MDDLLNGTSSRDTGRGGVLLPEGFYPELRLVKAEIFRQFGGTKPRTFTCDVEVLAGPEGSVGKVGSGPYEQLEGNAFPSYDVQGRARVMVFLGALFGYSNAEQIDANINGQTLALVVSDLQPSTGTVFSARVTHRVTKKGKTIQNFTEIAPVLENGAPKVVRGKGQQQNPAPTPPPGFANSPQGLVAAAPVAVTPPPPPAAAPAAPAIPAGFALHPLNEYAKQGWVFEVANPKNMQQIPGLTG